MREMNAQEVVRWLNEVLCKFWYRLRRQGPWSQLEVEREGKDAFGNPKHWHVFHVVARRPPRAE